MGETVYAGEEQMHWLKEQLQSSYAVFKIVVHGGTIRRAGKESRFERSKHECRELMDFIAEKNIVRELSAGFIPVPVTSLLCLFLIHLSLLCL